MRRALTAFTLILLLSVAIAASRGGDLSRKVASPAAASTGVLVTKRGASPALEVAEAFAAYVTASDAARVGDYLTGRIAGWVASRPPPPPTPAPYTQNPSVQYPAVQGACGGATNGADQFIQRESGGDPSALNPSGAWGCYQLMPEHFAPGGTCDDMPYGSATPAQQAECASRLPLSAWNL